VSLAIGIGLWFSGVLIGFSAGHLFFDWRDKKRCVMLMKIVEALGHQLKMIEWLDKAINGHTQGKNLKDELKYSGTAKNRLPHTGL
jgi:hypothetical protein